LLLAYGAEPVRAVVAQLDGCTGGKAGEIVKAAGLDRKLCRNVDREQASKLLEIARDARLVNPERRLGAVGRDAFPDRFYAVERALVAFGNSVLCAEIPFVVEAWAVKTDGGDIDIDLMINRTPSTDEVSAWRDSDKDLAVSGSGFDHYCPDAPKKGGYHVIVNITTPYCPITSDGKAPDLSRFAGRALAAISKALRKAQRAMPDERRRSQKDIVLENLDAVIAEVSNDGEFRFNSRQVLYKMRPLVRVETGATLTTKNFNTIITNYENEHGEIPGMYREPRGSLYHPHRGEDIIPLGTLSVEQYQRPLWTFNKLLFIEKEGFSEALKDDGWPERHDCALMSSKGFTTRAARDLVDLLAEHDEPVTVFCATDADAYGTMILQTFQEETKARGARKIQIVHLGLHPWEAIALGLEVEEIENNDEKYKPVADYVKEREDRAPDGNPWEDWLQTHRVELNAFTTAEFIEWLDDKMAAYGADKLIPPEDIIAAELEERLDAKVRAQLIEQILREGRFEERVAETLTAITRPAESDLAEGIQHMFEEDPGRPWREHVDRVATVIVERKC
jgi:hypothetical protein